MPAFIKNIINLLPTIIGLIQSILPLIKEIVVSAIRVIAILPIWFSTPDEPIKKVNAVYEKIYGAVEKIKNAILIIK